MKLFDRLNKEYKILKKEEIGMYFCGPTVYDHIHIGNIRPAIIGDVLFRLFLALGKKVTYVKNITDIDDKILNKANLENLNPMEIANRYLESYKNDCEKMNLLEPSFSPKVSENLEEIKNLINKMLKKNFAYKTTHGIYFNTSMVDYWQFEKKESFISRISNDEEKQQITDFALWKFSQSKFAYSYEHGNGFPGWHIECTAISSKYLGHSFHIHGGGIDLSFPHHNNEIVQNLSCFKTQPAHIWIHNEMININGEKMSKSLGNFKYLKDFLNIYEGNVIKYFILMHNYNKVIDLSDEKLKDSEKAISHIKRFYFLNIHEKNSINKKYLECLQNDLDSSLAIKNIHSAMKNLNFEEFFTLIEILGFNFKKLTKLSCFEIEKHIQERNKYRQENNYEKSDEIRKILENNFIKLEDNDKNTTWFYI